MNFLGGDMPTKRCTPSGCEIKTKINDNADFDFDFDFNIPTA
jgi:hypothetical protein